MEYTNAFNTIKYDLRYVYKTHGEDLIDDACVS